MAPPLRYTHTSTRTLSGQCNTDSLFHMAPMRSADSPPRFRLFCRNQRHQVNTMVRMRPITPAFTKKVSSPTLTARPRALTPFVQYWAIRVMSSHRFVRYVVLEGGSGSAVNRFRWLSEIPARSVRTAEFQRLQLDQRLALPLWTLPR